MTYQLRTGPTLTGYDADATLLLFLGRVRVISGDYGRQERDSLARLLEDGPLADLLKSDRPFQARSSADGQAYEFEEVEPT